MLTVTIPPYCVAECRWAVETVFGTMLRIPHRVAESRTMGITLTLDERSLHLPDAFFGVADRQWLQEASLPCGPWSKWAVAEDLPEVGRMVTSVPVLSGTGGFHRDGDGSGRLTLDVLGCVFLLLSRYEEHVLPERDAHGRFPLSASIAHRAGVSHRPLADEYVEILWHAMRRVWPTLTRPSRAFRVRVSCDVDQPYEGYTRSVGKTMRKVVGDVVKRRGWTEALRTALNAVGTRASVYRWDRYDSFDWMMDVNEAAGNVVTFYFIAGKSDSRYDPLYDLEETRIRQLLRRIHERGHEIGLHGSYGSADSLSVLSAELTRLRRVLDEESIRQDIVSSRQHYLRWIPGQTSILLDSLGLNYDSTLGFAEAPGFRCGTSHEYAMYDPSERRPLRLRERPLLVMEDSVLSESYLGLGAGEAALELMMRVSAPVVRFGGNFTLLWHNSTLNKESERALYRTVVANAA